MSNLDDRMESPRRPIRPPRPSLLDDVWVLAIVCASTAVCLGSLFGALLSHLTRGVNGQ